MHKNLAVSCYLVAIVFPCALHAQALDFGDVPTFPDVVPMPLEESCMRYLAGCKVKADRGDVPSKQIQSLKSCMLQNSCPRLSDDFLNKVVYVEQKFDAVVGFSMNADVHKESSANTLAPWQPLVTFLATAAGIWS